LYIRKSAWHKSNLVEQPKTVSITVLSPKIQFG
jgi:hypothetical protein